MSGPQCCENPPSLNPNSGAGHVEQLGGLSCYIAGSPQSKLAIIMVTDIYGTLFLTPTSIFCFVLFYFVLFLIFVAIRDLGFFLQISGMTICL